MLMLQIPPKVQPIHNGRQTLLTTPQGGRVWVDRIMLDVWQYADGRFKQDILSHFAIDQGLPADRVAVALECLAQAGLLARLDSAPSVGPSPAPSSVGNPLISALIVSYNSLAWLPGCLASLASQSLPPSEIIVVDNGSSDGSAAWLVEHHPDVIVLPRENTCSLAGAINQGISVARGEFILLLNPDVVLDRDALFRLWDAAQSDDRCAAVAAKLRLLWAPAFLNGVGNQVGALSWGMDNALGHLDLGQFDHWDELPSACFAAALLPTRALDQVGLLDDRFPMYYEDIEWCYRARWLGYKVRLAPGAIVYHAFSSRHPGAVERSLGETKLQRVVYGRLRFITRLLEPGLLFRFLISYGVEDLFNGLLCLFRGRWGEGRAYGRAWMEYLGSLSELRSARKSFRQRRPLADRELFRLQRQVPVPLIRQGAPLLTWDIVCHEYLPWIQSHRPARSKMSVRRAFSIWQVEGLYALIHRLGRRALWKLMQP
jgi:GT2 family glycosyltransferase